MNKSFLQETNKATKAYKDTGITKKSNQSVSHTRKENTHNAKGKITQHSTFSYEAGVGKTL